MTERPSITPSKTRIEINPNNTRREGDSWRFNTEQQLPPRFGGDINEVVIALRLVLEIVQEPCLPK